MRQKKWKGRNLWPLLYGIVLTGYAVFTLLDAFVIPRRLVSWEQISAEDSLHSQNAPSASMPPEAEQVFSEQPEPSDDPAAEGPTESEAIPSEPIITDNSYTSDTITITIQTLERYDTRVYVADVVLRDAACLRTAVANGTFGRNVRSLTSEMAVENNAILAVNGDYYGFRDSGFVMRQGYLYRDEAQQGTDYEDLVIYADGLLEVVMESQSDAAALAEAGAVQIFSFGPGLIQNGEITVTEDSEVGRSMASNPRTAIGQIEPLHYILAVSDGRIEESAGLSLLELAQVMSELGCRTAYNLDGGGSSTMWFMGKIINHPSDSWGERSVSDIVYVGY